MIVIVRTEGREGLEKAFPSQPIIPPDQTLFQPSAKIVYDASQIVDWNEWLARCSWDCVFAFSKQPPRCLADLPYHDLRKSVPPKSVSSVRKKAVELLRSLHAG